MFSTFFDKFLTFENFGGFSFFFPQKKKQKQKQNKKTLRFWPNSDF